VWLGGGASGCSGCSEVGVEVAGGGGRDAGKEDEMWDKGEVAGKLLELTF